jgi:hypothetical protein
MGSSNSLTSPCTLTSLPTRNEYRLRVTFEFSLTGDEVGMGLEQAHDQGSSGSPIEGLAEHCRLG